MSLPSIHPAPDPTGRRPSVIDPAVGAPPRPHRRRFPPGKAILLGLLLAAGAAALPPLLAAPAAAPPSHRAFPTELSAEPLEIVVFVDDRLRSEAGWRAALETGVAEAERLLADSLGRRLEIAETRPWPGVDPGSDSETLLANLLGGRAGPGPGIIVGLARARPGSDRSGGDLGTASSRGVASYEDGVVVLRVGDDLREIDRLLAHEIAHLFGAVHRPAAGLMSPEDPVSDMDPINAEIVALHRDRRFRTLEFAVAEEDRPRLRELYRRVLEAAPGSATRQALFRLARIDIEERRYDDCIAALEPIVADDPDAAEAWLLLGIAYRRSGRYREAVKAYDAIPAPHADRYQVHYDRGIALQHLGDIEGAAAAYRRAVELAPGFVPALGNLGHAAAEAGRPEEAIAVLERALELAPDDRNARVNLAYARFLAGDLRGARRAAREVLEAHPESAAAHDTLGQVLESEGRDRAAMRQFERAVELDPAYVPGLVNLARARLAAGDLEAAARAVDRARELRPSWRVVRRLRARILLAGGRWTEARDELESVLEAEPALGWAWVGLGHARFEAGETEEAAAAYQRALELGLEDGVVHNNLAVIHFRAGRTGPAWRHAVRARALDHELHPGFVAALEEAAGRELPDRR